MLHTQHPMTTRFPGVSSASERPFFLAIEKRRQLATESTETSEANNEESRSSAGTQCSQSKGLSGSCPWLAFFLFPPNSASLMVRIAKSRNDLSVSSPWQFLQSAIRNCGPCSRCVLCGRPFVVGQQVTRSHEILSLTKLTQVQTLFVSFFLDLPSSSRFLRRLNSYLCELCVLCGECCFCSFA